MKEIYFIPDENAKYFENEFNVISLLADLTEECIEVGLFTRTKITLQLIKNIAIGKRIKVSDINNHILETRKRINKRYIEWNMPAKQV